MIVHKLVVHGHTSGFGLYSVPSRSSQCPRITQRTSNLNVWMISYIYSQSRYFFSNFRTTNCCPCHAHATSKAFNGEIKQRTSNTWRLQLWCLSSQDLLNDLFQQKLHHIITEQRTLSSKRIVCGNSHPRHNHRMHHRR